MKTELDEIREKLAAMENEIRDLREYYTIVNDQYTEALETLSELTEVANESAISIRFRTSSNELKC